MATKTGPELLKDIADHKTLDLIMDRNPYSKPHTDVEAMQLLEIERHERLNFNFKAEKKRDKKAGIVDYRPNTEVAEAEPSE